MFVEVLSYDEYTDQFICKLSDHENAEQSMNLPIDAAYVAESCPETEFLEDLPFDLVGQKFHADIYVQVPTIH